MSSAIALFMHYILNLAAPAKKDGGFKGFS
jgi:hypothetical protein